jgi:hypothetical protein
MAATRTPVALDQVGDPATGLTLLGQRPRRPETPEQKRMRLFWKFQFEQWRNWLNGDTLAFGRALYACSVLSRPPPRWLRDAGMKLSERGMSDAERRDQGNLQLHLLSAAFRPASHLTFAGSSTPRSSRCEAADRMMSCVSLSLDIGILRWVAAASLPPLPRRHLGHAAGGAGSRGAWRTERADYRSVRRRMPVLSG